MQNNERLVRILRIVMLTLAAVAIVGFPPWDGILAWLEPLPDTVQGQVEKGVEHGLDGMIVYVDQAGQPPASYAAGWNDRAAGAPADPEALFKIGSISKLYIAAAAAKLAAAGSLSLDDTLADHLPELVGRIENADQITLRMMLQHRSGIPNFVDQPGYPWFETLPDRDAYLAFALDQPADFAPDSEYRYSNTGYLLIGDILDKVLGYSHHQYIQDEIVAPLGLTQTFSLLSEVNLADVASGYHVGVDEDLKELDHLSPGGSMIATAQDVAVFVRALNDGSLFNAEEQAIYSSIYDYGHTGWVPGYQSIARYHPDIDAVVVQFVSTTGGTPILPFFDTAGGTKVMVSEMVYNRILRILRGQ
jgi:CubicO group peptidase (beta-lactamase class C family)